MKGIVLALTLLAAVPSHAGISTDYYWQGDLTVHGRWVWVTEIGEVWVPSVHVTWQPYLNGHWAWSPWGWMWVSGDPWGYLTDHYGRWLWTPYHGWVWVPGRVWAPAWVVWISGPGWIGWSPAAPDWCHGYWRRPDYHRHHHRWVVVHDRGFFSPSLADQRLPEHRVKTDVVRALDYREKGSYSRGAPEREVLERVTGKSAPEVRERQGTVRTPEVERIPHRERTVIAPRVERQREVVRERAKEPARDYEMQRREERPATPSRSVEQPVRDDRKPAVREERRSPERDSPATPPARVRGSPERVRSGEASPPRAAGHQSRNAGEGRARR